jgi:hypothetical protein
MKTTSQLLLMLLLVSSVGFAADSKGASNKTGNDLLPSCSLAVDAMDGKNLSTAQLMDSANCLAYLSGFIDGYVLGAVGGSPIACFPEDGTVGQVARIVVKWMKDHPEKLNEAAPVCVLTALYNAFPCKTSK